MQLLSAGEFTLSGPPVKDGQVLPQAMLAVFGNYLKVLNSVETRQYDSERAARIIASPVRMLEHLWTESEEVVIQAERARLDRLKFEFPACRKVAESDWYWQGAEPLCIPVSMLIASNCLGKLLKPTDFANLLNLALPSETKLSGGVSFYEVTQCLDSSDGSTIKLRRLSKRSSLKRSPYFSLRQASATDPFAADYEVDRFIRKKTGILAENARVIMKAIDSGAVLLVGITESFVKSRGAVASSGLFHCICLIGYQIDKSGHLDIQVADPANGKYMVGLEHLSRILKNDHTHVAVLATQMGS